METKLISVIVPVYNTEAYLAQCIESILNQTYRNLEIILVDDGSVDSSEKICDEYAKKDSRIKVIHQKNQGQQTARSVGIENATGEYIGFVDSDDWIDNNLYENLYGYIGTSDLVTSGIWQYNKNGDRNKWTDLFKPGKYDYHSQYFCNNLIVYSGKNGKGQFGGILNNLVCKLFKTSIVKECYQKANVNIKNGEDLLFTLIFVLTCNEIVVTHDCYYHYRYNSSSISHSKNMDYLIEISRFYKTLDQIISGHLWEKSLKKQLNRAFLYYVYENVDYMMQIDEDIGYPKYKFPQITLLTGKKIVLFGCGKVGISFYKDWKYNYDINIVGWIDNMPPNDNVLGQKIVRPETIVSMDFDYIVCAVMLENQADKMRKQLIQFGIENEKILWKLPINIFRNFFLENRSIDI